MSIKVSLVSAYPLSSLYQRIRHIICAKISSKWDRDTFSERVIQAELRNILENQSSLLIKAISTEESVPTTNYKYIELSSPLCCSLIYVI